MKSILVLSAFVFFAFTGVRAEKVNPQKLSQTMQESIHKVVKDNPEKYETRSPGRFPASVSPIEPSSLDVHKEAERHKMDDLRNQQGIGLPKW